LPDDAVLTGLSLVLKPTPEQDAALLQLLADQQDPSKPNYHQWLTPAQFGARFGMADADLSVLRTWLERAGLHVDEVAASRNSIRFSGTAVDLAGAFGTPFGRYQVAGQSFYENSAPIQLPDSIAAVVSGVSGLSSYRLTPQHVRMSAEQIAAEAATSGSHSGASAQFTTTTTKGSAHYLVPWDFRQIYGINALIHSGFDGTGIKIGVIGQSAVDTQQLTYFQGKTGQAVKMPAMLLVPNTGVSNRVSGDEAESELDLEYTSGSAPGAQVQFIYTGCTATASPGPLSSAGVCSNDGVLTALSYAITNNVAPILSLSYGGCESGLATVASTTLEPLLEQANAQGQTLLVSSGDSGAAACDKAGSPVAVHGLTVQYPSSSNYVTAVGGTQLNSDSSGDWSNTNNSALGSANGYMPETTWNDTPVSKVLIGSTGGVSGVYPMPAWQRPYVLPGASFRMVPDVSFPASVAFHPYMVCLGDGACTSGTGGFVPGTDGAGVGGTSVATPNLAAMLAVIEQANGGGALGNVNPALYALAAGPRATSIFHDITTGDNIVPCTAYTPNCSSTGSMGYSAGTGYDLTTGLGSLDAGALRTALQSLPTRGVTLSIRAIPQQIDNTSVQLGTPFTVMVNALSNNAVAPTGNVTLKVDGVALANAQTLFQGEAMGNVTLNTLGQHRIDAVYAGDANFDGGTASITVATSKAVPSINAGIYGGSAALNASVPIMVSVYAGTVTPTGTVTIVIDGAVASPELPASNGIRFNYSGFQTAGRHTIVAKYSGDPLITAGSSRSSVVIVDSPTRTQSATVTVVATPGLAPVGTPVTLTASVKGSGTTSSPVPTGFMTYVIDGVDLPTLPLDATGHASISYTFNPDASGNVFVSYSGDNIFSPGEGSFSVPIQYPPKPAIALALSTTATTIPSTGAAAIGLTVNSLNGFSGPVSFRTAIVSGMGAAFKGCYVVSPGVVNPSPNSPATATFTMALAGNSLCTKANVVRMGSAAAAQVQPTSKPATWAAVASGMLLSLAVFRRRMPRGLLAMLALAGALGMTGCGGGGGSSTATTPTTTTPVTTPSTSGTYQVQVTATALTTGVSSYSTFTLTVQ
jgi:hypothetical protein